MPKDPATALAIKIAVEYLSRADTPASDKHAVAETFTEVYGEVTDNEVVGSQIVSDTYTLYRVKEGNDA